MSKSIDTKVTAVMPPVSDAAAHAPLYASSPAAGFPSPGDDMVESELNIHDLLVTHPYSTFFVRVSGDSMEGAGIFSGDILVVDRSITPRSGVIVVAAVYGELVVKRLGVRDGQQVLLSEHDGYQPIYLSEADDCHIWGVVTGSVRKF